jgi:hypothetical protein
MESMTLFFVLGGLLFLTLTLASIAQRYQAYVEERRRRVRRILQRVGELEETLFRMSGLPVPVEAERIVRSEILARLQIAKTVHPGYRGIDAMIAAAEKTAAEVKPVGGGRLLDHARLESLLQTLGEVLWMLKERRNISPLTETSPRQLMLAIAQRRAECVYRYHWHEADHMAQDGQLHQALWHCRRILSFIDENGPEDDQVDTWYREAGSRCREIEKQLRGQSNESSPE